MRTALADADRWGKADTLIVAVLFAVYAIHSVPLFDWVIDDAGISYAYSRNLAHGHGLVSQPGMEPVEGFSNPSWVLLMAAFFGLGLFHPYLTSKAVAAILVLVTLTIFYRGLRSALSMPRIGAGVVLLLTVMNPSYTIWTMSGLENALYALLVVGLITGTWSVLRTARFSARRAAGLGALAFLAAITRPEGIIYGVIPPLLVLIHIVSAGVTHRRDDRRILLPLLVYGLTVLVMISIFVACRLLYFGDPLPNTFYAKGGSMLSNAGNMLFLRPVFLQKLHALLNSVAGPLGIVLALALVLGLAALALTRRIRKPHVDLLAGTLISGGIYLTLPPDWMKEFRFATPFFPLFFALTVAAGHDVVELLISGRRVQRLIKAGLMLAAIAYSATIYVPRTLAYAAHPDVPLRWIKRNYSDRFESYADRLEVVGGSLLLPPLGGTLFYSDLRIHDLAGLCDRTIARTVYYRPTRDLPKFHEYVFEEIRPTFVVTRMYFTYMTRLHEDPRFGRDYVPLLEYADPWVLEHHDLEMPSGAYVRRDAVADPAALARIRDELVREPLAFIREP